MNFKEYITESKYVNEADVVNNFTSAADAYKAHLYKTLPSLKMFLSKTIKGWAPSDDDFDKAIEIAYKHVIKTGDIKEAGTLLMKSLNASNKSLH